MSDNHIDIIIELKDSLLRNINSLKNILENLEKDFDKVNHFIRINCNHSWVTDLIDIDPDKSQTICYCKYCEISKYT